MGSHIVTLMNLKPKMGYMPLTLKSLSLQCRQFA